MQPSYQAWAQDLLYQNGVPVTHVTKYADPTNAGTQLLANTLAPRLILAVDAGTHAFLNFVAEHPYEKRCLA
jgi:hypothetical protein